MRLVAGAIRFVMPGKTRQPSERFLARRSGLGMTIRGMESDHSRSSWHCSRWASPFLRRQAQGHMAIRPCACLREKGEAQREQCHEDREWSDSIPLIVIPSPLRRARNLSEGCLVLPGMTNRIAPATNRIRDLTFVHRGRYMTRHGAILSDFRFRGERGGCAAGPPPHRGLEASLPPG